MAKSVFIVSCNVNELNITNCVINPTYSCMWLSRSTTGKDIDTTGTFNFKRNVLYAPVKAAIIVAGTWNININYNMLISPRDGANVLSYSDFSEEGLVDYYHGTIDINFNYWGSNNPTLDVDEWPEMWIEFHACAVHNYDDDPVDISSGEIYTDEYIDIIVGAFECASGCDAVRYLPNYPITATLSAEGTLTPSSVNLNGASGVHYVAYTSNVARSDNVIVNIVLDETTLYTVTIPITVKERYKGIIYVDNEGSDDNEGSIDAPVETIDKAIELALADGGSNEIIINEGTYVGNGYHVTDDLTVTGNGKVTLDANNEGRLFYMDNYDIGNVDKIVLSNLILTNASGDGAIIYSVANELILGNVTVVNNQATGCLIRSSGKLTIKDSNIANSRGGTVINQYNPGDMIINNTVFEDNSILDTDSHVIYVEGRSNLFLENSKFINNTADWGVIYGSGDMFVKGAEFIDNTNAMGSGGAIFTMGDILNVTDSVFINNKAHLAGGAIYAGGFTIIATVDRCIFVNNSAGATYEGDAISNQNMLSVNNSVLLTNADQHLIFNEGENNGIYAQNNWWGTNDDPKDLVGSGYYLNEWEEFGESGEVDVSNWVTMDASFEPVDAHDGDEVTVTAVFSNPNLPDGIEVAFTSTSGLDTVVSTVDAQASTTYTIDADDKEINATSGSAVIVMPIRSNIATNLSAEDLEMTFKDGSTWTVTLTDGTGPIEGAVVKVGILNKTYSLKTGADGTVSLPINVAPGTYDVNATFEGDETYESAFVNSTVTVSKAVSTLTAENLTMAYKNGSWIVTLTGAEGAIPKAAIKFGIVGKVYTIKTDENGVVALAINLVPNTYEINATFEGNAKHESSFVSATVTVEKSTVAIASEDLTMRYKDGSAYEVTVTDANGAPVAGTTVKFTLGTKSYNIKTDANGVAALAINLNVGEYTVSAVVDDAKYTSEEATHTVTVKDYDAVLVSNDINMTYHDGTNYEVQLTTADGAPIAVANLVVKITLNGMTYNIKTDAEGIAKVPINLRVGNYTVTAEYNGAEVTNTIFVNKA